MLNFSFNLMIVRPVPILEKHHIAVSGEVFYSSCFLNAQTASRILICTVNCNLRQIKILDSHIESRQPHSALRSAAVYQFLDTLEIGTLIASREHNTKLPGSAPMKPIDYVAILGFANQVNEQQAYLAKDVARKLTALGYGVGVGNLSGMFNQALKSTKSCGGATMAIIEKDVGKQEHQDCDILLVSSSQETKHQALSTRCIGGIVIGGGPGTLKLIQHFLDRNKKIIAIDGSGGVVPSELAKGVILSHSVDQALGLLTQ